MEDGITKHSRNLRLLTSKCTEITNRISKLKIPGSVKWTPPVSKSPFQCILGTTDQPQVNALTGIEHLDKLVFDTRIISRDAEFSILYQMEENNRELNDTLRENIRKLDKELSSFKSERKLALNMEGHIPTNGRINSIVTQLDIILMDTRELLSLMHFVAPTDEEIDAGLDAEKVHGYVAGIRENPLEGFAARSLAKHIQDGF